MPIDFMLFALLNMVKEQHINVVYILGAGRSGTTILATILGNAKNIITLGEMHQLLDGILENRKCSCNENLDKCPFWKPVVEELCRRYDHNELTELNRLCKRVEKHHNIPLSFVRRNKKYVSFQEELFKIVKEVHPSHFYLDSSKYIARALQIQNLKDTAIKYIYVVRDIRGVISSFKKKVQTPKNPISTVLYYMLINLFGQLFYIFKRNVTLKVRYEDFINNPGYILGNIETFIDEDLNDLKTKLINKEDFLMPHIVGGNRIKSDKSVRLRSDFIWKSKLTKVEKVLYYILAFPIMALNKYKLK